MSDGQRLDLFLWHARIVRTRALATSLAASGHVRLNGTRAEKAHKRVRIGDVLTLAAGSGVRVLKIRAFAQKRGDANQAALLYEDIAPLVRSPLDGGDTRMGENGHGSSFIQQRML